MSFWHFFQKKPANTKWTRKTTIVDQMNEPRPLPMGVTEFNEWCDRIISGALIPTDDRDSLVAALASMLMSLGPTEDHKPDAYFIHALRKAATNEVAHHMFQDIKRKKQAELDALEKAKTDEDLSKVSASS